MNSTVVKTMCSFYTDLVKYNGKRGLHLVVLYFAEFKERFLALLNSMKL